MTDEPRLYANDPDVSVRRMITDADGGPMDFTPSVLTTDDLVLEAEWLDDVETAAGVSKRPLEVSLFADDGQGANQLAAGIRHALRLVIPGVRDADLGSEFLH